MVKLIYHIHSEIDKQKWDQCVQNSVQAIIYAESAYLDHMAGIWDAIVLGDYEAVMPICSRKKWGIRYLYQPAFIQQGGIFSSQKLTIEIVKAFLDVCIKYFRFSEIHVNYGNQHFNDISDKLIVESRNNFILDLHSSYESIRSRYKPYFTERIRRASKWEMTYQTEQSEKSCIDLFQQLYGNRMKGASPTDWKNIRLLIAFYHKQNRVFIRSVYAARTGEKLASVLLLSGQGRLYNLMSSVTDQGKKMLANYFLYNEVIREFSGKSFMLDFEGSDLPGVAYWYEKISNFNQPYFFLRYNHLPFLLRWLK